MSTNLFDIDGKTKGAIELPEIFSTSPREDLIMRAINAENTLKLQPQGHYPLAGMQTTATYYGAMHSYRTGRHMGIAIRPREKRGGGVQGKVRVIPSSVGGKRAHPHVTNKILIERMNKKEYQLAIISAIAASTNSSYNDKDRSSPIVVSNEIENIKRSKDLEGILAKLKLKNLLEDGKKKRIRKGLRRSSSRRKYKKTLLIIMSKDSPTILAARNMPGIDVCKISDLRVNLLAPGGKPRFTLWSEDALKGIGPMLKNYRLE